MTVKTIPRTNPKYALDRRHHPVATVDIGESFVVETHDARTGTITSPDQVRELLDTRSVNPVTGPIWINGATSGSTLCIEVEEVRIDSEVGLMLTRPGTTALAVTDAPQLRIVACDGIYADAGAFRVPLAPMIGVIGVAPNGDPVPTLRGGEHGGNMDTRLVRAGSRVFLPAFLDGGLVYFGDVHAAMGDGEVFLSGVEIAGRIRVSVTLTEDWRLPTPFVETEDRVAVIASGETLDEAANAALAKGLQVLTAGGMDPIDAGYLMSACGHLRVCQYLPGIRLVHCRFELPKSVLSLNGITLPGLRAAPSSGN